MQKPFNVEMLTVGADPIWPDTRASQYSNLAEALGAAEDAWKVGEFEMVNVTDIGPLASQKYPKIIWLKQRTIDRDERPIVESSGVSVHIPDFPTHMTLWMSYVVPAKCFCASFGGSTLPNVVFLDENKRLIDLIDLLANGRHLDFLGAVSLGPLQFDGFLIKDDCAIINFALSAP